MEVGERRFGELRACPVCVSREKRFRPAKSQVSAWTLCFMLELPHRPLGDLTPRVEHLWQISEGQGLRQKQQNPGNNTGAVQYLMRASGGSIYCLAQVVTGFCKTDKETGRVRSEGLTSVNKGIGRFETVTEPAWVLQRGTATQTNKQTS